MNINNVLKSLSQRLFPTFQVTVNKAELKIVYSKKEKNCSLVAEGAVHTSRFDNLRMQVANSRV